MRKRVLHSRHVLRLSPEQRQAAAEIAEKLKTLFPNEPPELVLTQAIAPAYVGEPPKWSQPSGYQLGVGSIYSLGAFCVYYGEDPDTHERVALVQERKELRENGEPKLGAIGGNCQGAEQVLPNVLRETAEEIRDAKGEPVFTPKVENYVSLWGGIDYFITKAGKQPVHYSAYAYQLSPEEIGHLKNHIEQLKDPAYKAAAMEASEGETRGIKFLPLKEIPALPQGTFRYYRQQDAYKDVLLRSRLRPSSPIGYTLGDNAASLAQKMIARGDKMSTQRGG